MADSWLSATGVLLAVIAVVGSVLTADSEQTWIDPVAALLVASAATLVGVVEFRREERAL
jgi:divalent metal cation (Fe/Co/Zn/Cd) transporter